MNNLPKLIKHFTAVLLSSFILLLFVNLALLIFLMAGQMPTRDGSPYTVAAKTADALTLSEDGYVLQNDVLTLLKEKDIWAFIVDNDKLQIVWNTDNLPETVPREFTLSDISDLSVGYLNEHPTYVAKVENGIVVLGYPKGSFWKHTRASWDYNLFTGTPKAVLIIFIVNIGVIFLIYIVVNMRFLKPLKPITKGIRDLSLGEPVHISEAGLLSDISANINRSSDILQEQRQQLRKKESARANWIAGVSHDIRTPLSMVMGYASRLKDNKSLGDEERKQAEVIVKQSKRMQNLINDLNLASKLEYNMQPINLSKHNLITLVRRTVVDFLNMDIEDKYPIEWDTDETLNLCFVYADEKLLERALGNLIQNSMNHNEHGCTIHVCITEDEGFYNVSVSDNGIGATDELIEKLNNTPHYMLCDENTNRQRHGLGLLIVKQIVSVHSGITLITNNPSGGFCVKLMLPKCKESI